MDEEKNDKPPHPFFGLLHPGLAPNFDGSAFDQTKFDEIAGYFRIEAPAQINRMIVTLLAAEGLYLSEEAGAARSISSGALKAKANNIRKVAKKLHALLVELDTNSPNTELLQWHYGHAALALVTSDTLRQSHPLVQNDPSAGGTAYSSPRIEQIIPTIRYLELLSELVTENLEPNPPGRKEKRSIRIMVELIRDFWVSDLGHKATLYKDPMYPNTNFEEFLEACTAPIAPGRWAEIRSIASHISSGPK
ncbi:MAG: hypothetical protein RH945_02420 [Hyphomonas sp.]